MPVKSYIVIPQKGKTDTLKSILKNIDGVEIAPSLNKDVIVVVTETPSEEKDKELYNDLNQMETIQFITLVSAFSEGNESK